MPTNLSSRPTHRSSVMSGFAAVLVGLTLLTATACKSSKQADVEASAPPVAAQADTTTDGGKMADGGKTTHYDKMAGGGTTSDDGKLSVAGKMAANGSDAASGQGIVARKPPAPGLVWVNTKTGVYHTESSQHYGKTAQGQWMKEAKAKAKGYRAIGAAKPGASAAPEAAAKPAATTDHAASADHGDPTDHAATTDHPAPTESADAEAGGGH